MPEELRGRYQYLTEARIARLRQAGFTAAFTDLETGVKTYVQRYLSQRDLYL
jgi:ADP-L-glycero-D-manno-heptose 6-epimerase